MEEDGARKERKEVMRLRYNTLNLNGLTTIDCGYSFIEIPSKTSEYFWNMNCISVSIPPVIDFTIYCNSETIFLLRII